MDIQESTKFINLGIIISGAGQVLMIRRAKEEIGKDGKPLTWAFPGGKQRLTESRNECVKREVLAETGYEVKPLRQLALRLHPNFPMHIAYHLCKLLREEPVVEPSEPHEVAEIKWVDADEVLKIAPEMDPAVRAVIEAAAQGRG